MIYAFSKSEWSEIGRLAYSTRQPSSREKRRYVRTIIELECRQLYSYHLNSQPPSVGVSVDPTPVPSLSDAIPTHALIPLLSDDYMLASSGPRFTEALMMALLTARVFGFPIKWAKCTGDFRFTWIGLELALPVYRLGFSERRAAWMDQWFSKVLRIVAC